MAGRLKPRVFRASATIADVVRILSANDTYSVPSIAERTSIMLWSR